jgi:hypothetical protein
MFIEPATLFLTPKLRRSGMTKIGMRPIFRRQPVIRSRTCRSYIFETDQL